MRRKFICPAESTGGGFESTGDGFDTFWSLQQIQVKSDFLKLHNSTHHCKQHGRKLFSPAESTGGSFDTFWSLQQIQVKSDFLKLHNSTHHRKQHGGKLFSPSKSTGGSFDTFWSFQQILLKSDFLKLYIISRIMGNSMMRRKFFSPAESLYCVVNIVKKVA